jgi:hypothetical protein
MHNRSTRLDDDNEEMRRCRQVRDEMDRRYNTVHKLCAHIRDLEKKDGKRRYVNLAARPEAAKQLRRALAIMRRESRSASAAPAKAPRRAVSASPRLA